MPTLPDFHKFVAPLRRRLRAQRTPLRVAGAFVYLPVLLLLSGTGLFVLLTEAHMPFFTREAKAVYGIPFHAGALSDIAVFLWCAATSVCLLTSIVLWRNPAASDKARFLLGVGVFTAVLMLDDAFLLHENFGPEYLGLSEKVIYASYALFAVSLFAYYRRVIYRSAYVLLLLSLAFLAGSIAFDLMNEAGLLLSEAESRGLQHFLEDGSKLLGVAGWLGYFGWISYTSLIRQHTLETPVHSAVSISARSAPSRPAAQPSSPPNGSKDR